MDRICGTTIDSGMATSYFRLVEHLKCHCTVQLYNDSEAYSIPSLLFHKQTYLSHLDDEGEPARPEVSSSPSPAPSLSSCCSSSSSHQTRLGKQKRDTNMDLLLDYLERSEERQQEQSRKEEQVTSALLQSIQKMEDRTSTLVGLMGHVCA
ncbi:uncharacterized protein KZ484_016508 isoform 2-T2 [Pholidichthys leucotaenia]